MEKIRSFFRWILSKPLGYAVVFWLVLLVLLFVLADQLAIPLLAGKYSPRRDVPQLVGLTIAEAEESLAKLQLGVRWADEGRYSSDVPAGSVLIQVPTPGRVVKKGRTIFLTVSKGVREVGVPELRGRSRRQAEISLQRLGLFQGEDILGAHASIPNGVIIRTVPESGRMVRVGDTVQLVISTGARNNREMLPELVGLSLSRASETLQELGFVRGEVRSAAAAEGASKLPQTVVQQYPLAGEFLLRGDTVSLTVVE